MNQLVISLNGEWLGDYLSDKPYLEIVALYFIWSFCLNSLTPIGYLPLSFCLLVSNEFISIGTKQQVDGLYIVFPLVIISLSR